MLHNLNNGLRNKLVLIGHKQKNEETDKNINNKVVVITSERKNTGILVLDKKRDNSLETYLNGILNMIRCKLIKISLYSSCL